MVASRGLFSRGSKIAEVLKLKAGPRLLHKLSLNLLLIGVSKQESLLMIFHLR